MKSAPLKLSVIVPVFNEAPTIRQILNRLVGVKEVAEVVVVDDGSTDNSVLEIKKLLKKSTVAKRKIRLVSKPNGGKGSAIVHGLSLVTGTHVLIQDADLEYSPEDIPALLLPIKRQLVQVVFGSRFLGPHSNLLFWHRVGNSFLNFMVNLLYDTTLSDMETCYKVLPRQLFLDLKIKSQKFDIEPEITCKVLKRGIKIFEVPISYLGRDFSEGKKITWKDGLSAIGVILQLRFLYE